MTHAPLLNDLEPIAPFDFIGFLGTLWRGKWIIAAVTVVTVLVAGYYAFAMTKPRFAAVTTLKIDLSEPRTRGAAPEIAGLPIDPMQLKTEAAVLRSPHLMRQVVDELDLLSDPAFNRYLTPIAPWAKTDIRNRLRSALTGQPLITPDANGIIEKTVQNLAGHIDVTPLRETHIFRITATTGDAVMSARIADTLAQVYLADQIAAKRDATEDTFAWLSDRVGQLKQTLEQQETAVNDIITTYRADDPAVLDALSRQSIETRNRLQETERALLAAEIRQAGLRPAVSDASLATPSGRAQVMAETGRLTNQIASLRAFQAEIDTKLADQSAHQVRLQQLQREADATRVLYQSFLTRLQETSAQRGPQNADGRILARAAPGQYAGPHKVLILLMAAIIGLVSGTALVLLRRALDRRFDAPDAICNAMALPILSQTPPMSRRFPMMDQIAGERFATAMRHLRTHLMLTRESSAPQIVLFTAPQRDRQKTAQVLGLGQSFADLQKRVLIVVADADTPQLARGCGTLQAAVSGTMNIGDAVYRDPRLNADILQVGPDGAHPADIYASDAFMSFVETARATYDMILFDAPPVVDGPETPLLAKQADAVVYVIMPERTVRRTANAGLETLWHSGARVLGITLSHVRKSTAFRGKTDRGRVRPVMAGPT